MKLVDTQTVTALGTYPPNSLTKFPEGGGNFGVYLSVGSATVVLRGWNYSMPGAAKETLVTFTIPRAGDSAMFDNFEVETQWDQFDWVVSAISGGGTLRLSCVGVGY